jgi:hypothetical protein
MPIIGSNAAVRSYAGEVDFIAVHCPETDEVYLIPIDAVPLKRQAALRVEPPRNSQRRRIRPAAKYAIGSVAVRPLDAS